MIAGLGGQILYIALSCYYVDLLQEVCHMFSTLTKDGDAAVLRGCFRFFRFTIEPSSLTFLLLSSVPVKTVSSSLSASALEPKLTL